MKQIDSITYSELKNTPSSDALLNTTNYMDLIADLELNLEVRVGKTTLNVAQLQSLTKDQVLPLDKAVQDPIDLCLNGKVIAQGQLVLCEDSYAIRLTCVHETAQDEN